MDEQIPEDSIFSNPIWNKGFNDPNASQVQMDPATAMQQGQIKSTVQSVIRGVSMTVLALAVVAGGIGFMLSRTATSTQASIDLKHAILGTVDTVSEQTNIFTLKETKSDDQKILLTGIMNWTVELPPGVSFTKEATSKLSTCYTISSFDRNFNDATPVSCINFLQPGNKVVTEYLIVKPESSAIITKKIIREE